jgi:hypothetical protein
LLPCPFCHNTTLQHYRLLSVTINVTREKVPESRRADLPKIHLQKEKRCMLAVARLVADFSAGCALPVITFRFLATHPHAK